MIEIILTITNLLVLTLAGAVIIITAERTRSEWPEYGEAPKRMS